MGHLDEHKRIRPADGLQAALKAVREDDALARPGPQLRERVMRAWDTRQQHRKTPRSSTFWLAAAASVALVLTWSSSQSPLDNGRGMPQPNAQSRCRLIVTGSLLRTF